MSEVTAPARAVVVVDSPIGPLSVRVDGEAGVRRVRMGDEDAVPRPAPGTAAGELASRAATELAEYFAGTRETFTVEPDWERLEALPGHVLRTLLRIAPYGRTVSYGELAAAAGIADELPARVAGQILNANPWPVIVPCHRVIMSDGSLGGFGGAVWRKEVLLRHEGRLPATLF
ncbi:MAG TPA: methylated-DNA--[protein]-cysteine S-methyltransferase [Pseudonocardiaceae bacterium]